MLPTLPHPLIIIILPSDAQRREAINELNSLHCLE
jgi:hypothetical protein